MKDIDRRRFLELGIGGALALGLPLHLIAQEPSSSIPTTAKPFPLESVRLTPSMYLDSINANIRYLHKLEPDRFLHNFRVHAGLRPKGDVYGGWEADTIAGHSLGHYLTACSQIHAHTGDEECKRRVEYIVAELAQCQAQAPDGYVAAFTRRKDKKIYKLLKKTAQGAS